MELKMENGVLTVSENGKSIEVAVVDGEIEVFGNNVVVEEMELEEETEELIEFPEEPDMPKNSKAHLVDQRTEHYPLIKGLKVGDKVKLRLDLDENLDDIEDIGLYDNYYEMLADLSEKDLTIKYIVEDYDEISDTNEDCLYIEGWYLSTRWVTKVE